LAIHLGACRGIVPQPWCRHGIQATAGDGLCCSHAKQTDTRNNASGTAPQTCNVQSVAKNRVCRSPVDVSCWIPVRKRRCHPFTKSKTCEVPGSRKCPDVTDGEDCNPCVVHMGSYCCNTNTGECNGVNWLRAFLHQLELAYMYLILPFRLVSPNLLYVLRGTAPRSLVWPSAPTVRERLASRLGPGYDHLELGMTRDAMRDAVVWILPGYRRSRAWIENGHDIVGYDLQHAIQDALKMHGLEDFSIAEVMLALGHPGVGHATVFLSHTQAETVTATLTACRNFVEQDSFNVANKLCPRRCSPQQTWEQCFWLDYFSLRQLRQDFTFDRVKDTINNVGMTAVVVETAFSTPLAAQRSFCCFEIYATLSHPRKKLQAAMVEEPPLSLWCRCRSLRPPEFRLQDAKCRDPAHQQHIYEQLCEDPGIDMANSDCASALKSSIQQHLCIRLFNENLFYALAPILFYLFLDSMLPSPTRVCSP